MFLWVVELQKKSSTDRTKLPQVIQIYVHVHKKQRIYSWTKSNVCAVMDDRAAEEVIYGLGKVTTGNTNICTCTVKV